MFFRGTYKAPALASEVEKAGDERVRSDAL
jgi:hypothetical protein